jgi:6-phosphogluconolactonase
MKLFPFDERRNVALGDTKEEAIHFAVEHWIKTARAAIAQQGQFAVALSGGSTPAAIYTLLSSPRYAQQLDWSKVLFFWSDERPVPPTHPENNYQMALNHGLAVLPAQFFRMEADYEIEINANRYEELIKKLLGPSLFDLVMLGVGEDGHTASLFPNTEALQENHRLVVPNFLPHKKIWRMTLTFPCINQSQMSTLYVLGASKQSIVNAVLTAPMDSPYPASRIGTTEHPALWIVDRDAWHG